MSTFGKVLVFLVLLLGVLWLFMAAGVDALNKNWEEDIGKIVKQTAETEEQVVKAKTELVLVRDEATRTQIVTGEVLATLRAKQAQVEQHRSAALEDKARAENLQATSEASRKGAEEDRDLRVAEVKSEQEALAKRQDDVKDLQKVNAEQMARLQKLRDEFKAVQKSNKDRVRQISR